ncbi:choline-sulfatase [Acidisoma sp. C75]
MAQRPNILILMADQLTASALPAYGNRVAKTPHLDRLAREGVVFDAAYCNSPLCAPSRAVFMSGRLPSATGAYDNAVEFPSQSPTFAHYLRDAGYRTILAGKMHFCGPDQLHGFEERLTTDIYPADFGWTPDWRHFDERPSWYHNMDSVTLAGRCVRTNQMDFDEEVGFLARQKIYDMARDSDRRPFCMVVSMTHPHDPFTMPDPYWSIYRDEEIDMPRVGAEISAEDPHAARLRHVCAQDAQVITEAQMRDARHAYYAAISYFDSHVGGLLRAVEESGFADETIVMVVADHGEMLGERGLWYKMSFYEGAARIPLIMHAPGRYAPHRVAAPVSLVDILPTLAAIAGDGTEPDYATAHDGRSLIPYALGADNEGGVIGEYCAEGVVAPMVMIRRGSLKFIHCPGDPDRLYDLAADPDELDNIAARAPGDARLAAFRAELAARWDLAELERDVLASQKRRRLIWQALQKGQQTSWDFQPVRDASQLYMRNHMKLDDLEARARFPRVAAVNES